MKNEDCEALPTGVGKATGPVGAMPLPWVDQSLLAGTQVGFSRLTKDAIRARRIPACTLE
jgi:hypothetical protein